MSSQRLRSASSGAADKGEKRVVWKSIKNIVVIVTLITFTSSCAKQIGNPYEEVLDRRFFVDNPRIENNQIQLAVSSVETIATKAEQTRRETMHDQTSKKFGPFLSAVYFYPLASITLVGISYFIIVIGISEKEPGIIAWPILTPLGGYFWMGTGKIVEKKEVVLKTEDSEPKPLAHEWVRIVEKNTHSALTRKTDQEGSITFPLNNRIIKLERIDLEIAVEGTKLHASINTLDYYKQRYAIKDTSKLRILYRHGDIFFSLSASEREYILSNLDSLDIRSQWDVLSVFVSARMHDYLNPDPPRAPSVPAMIPEPELPPVQEVAKSPFESRRAFESRMDRMKDQRNQQIQHLIGEYQKKVDVRNTKIRKLKAEYDNALQRHESLVSARQKNSRKLSREYMTKLFPKIFGQGKLTAAHTPGGAPQYDPEKGIMYATLYYGGKDNPKLEKTISFPNVSEGSYAENFYNALRGGRISPQVDFSFENNYFAVHSVIPENGPYRRHVGRESFDEFKRGEEIKVVLGHDEKDAHSRLAQAEKVDFSLQSAAVKDVKFELWMANEMRDFNDDIPALLEKTRAVSVDRSKWLFVIGIEDYQNTNRINFSRRSAEMFAEVAMKSLGIDKTRVFLLIDDGKTDLRSIPSNRIYPATTRSIKDQIRFLVRDVEKGDTIYFYYSGHGVPAIDDGHRPYIMAIDQSPDFISDEQELRIQEIYNTLSNSRAGQVFAFMDSCFTGETDGKSVFLGDIGAARLKPRETTFNQDKMAVITAGTANQFSNVYREKGHRLFSYYLMKALLKDHSDVGSLFSEVQVNTRSTSRDFGGTNIQEPTLKGNSRLRLSQ